ncbi:glutamate synthase subunit beta [Candidatus Poribacteria bacterium]|nr:glutamate synthase subunit beta [Candidatus Poribacteria bacterium]
MGKATGFLEFDRKTPKAQTPEERLTHWDEYYTGLGDDGLRQQGARCMDCGVPFCHTGVLIKGLAAGCPINNLIPEWNDLVYRGRWHEAFERLRKTNNFPEFTGRVCPAPCEASCVLGLHSPAVTIKNIECTIVDRAFEHGWVEPETPAKRTGKKVAVVGSGPSGLACAAQLNKAGHSVTVYERSDRIGGLLMYGIPNMKLDKRVVQRRVDLMAEAGVEFVTSTEIGKDLPAKKLVAENDAVVLCVGATKPRDLRVEGRELKGVHFALEFLTKNTRSLLNSKHADGQYISAKDKHVIVLGGADTGTDCVATSLRHGCKSMRQFDIIPRPPDERPADNPWPEWPRTMRVDYGQEECKDRFGFDPREYLISTKKFVDDGNGNVKELVTVDVEWARGENGRPFPKEVPGTERTWPADLVLLALGWLGPEDTILSELEIERDERSNARAKHGEYVTNVPGVFAAGDVRRGASLVVWAINEGRGAARECDRYLMGSTDLP